MKASLYFTPRLTESEHWIVNDLVAESCAKFDCTLIYYRKFKNGHHPGYREVKIVGDKVNLNKLRAFLLKEHSIETNVNRHRELKEEIKARKSQFKKENVPK